MLVLDNDGTLAGDLGSLSIVWGFFDQMATLGGPRVDHVATIASLFESTACLRPGLRQLFDRATDLRAKGRVSHIVMCTAADGPWVEVVRQALDKWYGSKVYDAVLSASDLRAWNTTRLPAAAGHLKDARGPVLCKDMNCVRDFLHVPNTAPVVIVEDRPAGVINASFEVEVPEYCAVLSPGALVRDVFSSLQTTPEQKEVFDGLLERHEETLRPRKDGVDESDSDTVLFDVAKVFVDLCA